MATMSSPSASQEPKLPDRVRLAIRAHRYSPRTEDAYIGWITRYISFHGKRHPREMGAPGARGRPEPSRPARDPAHACAPRTLSPSASRNRPQDPAAIQEIGRSGYF